MEEVRQRDEAVEDENKNSGRVTSTCADATTVDESATGPQTYDARTRSIHNTLSS